MPKQKKVVTILLALAVTGCLVWLMMWLFFGRGTEFTDNAYVQGNITAIAPKVAGYIVELPVDDNTPVRAGDLLFRIDERDYVAKLSEAEANVEAARAAVLNIEASIALQHATIVQADAQRLASTAVRRRASQENRRQTQLKQENATTEQSFEDAISAKVQADASLTGAQANLQVQQKKLDVLNAGLEAAKATLLQTEAVRDLAKLDLEHTKVRSPIDGVVGNRKVRVGRYVTPGSALLDVVPIKTVWIVANFKETQLEHIQVGQRVSISVDGYPGESLDGVVDSLAPGSGASFSLMPPDNATGNFVRVVQRVPVKIRFMESQLNGRLVPGLSARVTVHIQPQTGTGW